MSDLDKEMEEVLEGSAPDEPKKRGEKGDVASKKLEGEVAPTIDQPNTSKEPDGKASADKAPKPASKKASPPQTKSSDASPKAEETEHEEEMEDVQEMPKLKSDILAGLVDHMKGMKKEDLEKLYGSQILEQDDEEEEEEEEDDEDEKEKEAASESIEQRIDGMDLTSDVEALVEGEELSEEFKTKAATIFEAAVKSKVRTELEKMQEENNSIMEDLAEKTMTDVVEKVDDYLNYVVEQWMEENELAIERGLKGEIAEDFISGLKNLFEDHYIDVPDEKYDILEANLSKIEELEEKLNKQIEENVQLRKAKGELVKESMIADVANGMTDTETEKFQSLVEDVEFSDEESYKGKLQTIRESYFGTEKNVETGQVLTEEGSDTAPVETSSSMERYIKAIGKDALRAKK